MNRAARMVVAVAPLLALAAALLAVAHPAYSYLPNFATSTVRVKWSANSFPVQWNLNPSTGSNIVGLSTRPVDTVIQNAFSAWTAAPNTSLSVMRGADSSISGEIDHNNLPPNVNLICFVCTSTDFTNEAQTLAVTLFTFRSPSGEMQQAVTLFNPKDTFTTDPSLVAAGVNDLQTVATHELGHFFGLDHSAVVNAVMFPFSPDLREKLAYDDVAGISSLYPGAQMIGTGTIQGTIRFTSGGGVFGAHVFADSTTGINGFDRSSTNVRMGPIGTLTFPDGTYSITGLPPDTYSVTVEPLDQPVTNTDVSDYPKAFGQTAVQTNFTTRQH